MLGEQRTDVQRQVTARVATQRVEDTFGEVGHHLGDRVCLHRLRRQLGGPVLRIVRDLRVDERVNQRIGQELITGRPPVEERLAAGAGLGIGGRQPDHVLSPQPVERGGKVDRPQPGRAGLQRLVVQVGVDQLDGGREELPRGRVVPRRRWARAHRLPPDSHLLYCTNRTFYVLTS